MSDSSVDLTADPATLVDGLAALSERQTEEVLRGPNGDAFLDELFARMRDSFQPEKASGEDAQVQFELSGGPGGTTRTFVLAVRGAACELSIDPAGGLAPGGGRTVTVRTDRVRLVRIVAGQANAAKLYITRKVRIDGDLKFGGQVLSWFGVPTED
ncbi:SCP-2 sterol transfer family protein [Frankia sp. EI5c]|uniref:SCP2 sterol-binding domain-containing protein n=1 Tax=Frankia sp. EI5c TaxID=683316 RepID=UPI0007C21ABE|nr:SCP2 sterol-binding domain-containing protein [Frankia sp. EI5c]OAA24676.1 SCP-2 sterol transfer family protein [Frankia sp. EI5c]